MIPALLQVPYLLSIYSINAEETQDSFVQQLVDYFFQVIDAIIDAITAPFDAIAQVFWGWSAALGSYFGVAAPIGMAIILGATLAVMYAMFWMYDTFFN